MLSKREWEALAIGAVAATFLICGFLISYGIYQTIMHPH